MASPVVAVVVFLVVITMRAVSSSTRNLAESWYDKVRVYCVSSFPSLNFTERVCSLLLRAPYVPGTLSRDTMACSERMVLYFARIGSVVCRPRRTVLQRLSSCEGAAVPGPTRRHFIRL